MLAQGHALLQTLHLLIVSQSRSQHVYYKEWERTCWGFLGRGQIEGGEEGRERFKSAHLQEGFQCHASAAVTPVSHLDSLPAGLV
jgi:hypothetical protein